MIGDGTTGALMADNTCCDIMDFGVVKKCSSIFFPHVIQSGLKEIIRKFKKYELDEKSDTTHV